MIVIIEEKYTIIKLSKGSYEFFFSENLFYRKVKFVILRCQFHQQEDLHCDFFKANILGL